MSRSPWLLALVVAAVAALIGISEIDKVSLQPKADEGFYHYYTVAIAHKGPSVFPALLKEYLDNAPVRQHFPTPMRVAALTVDAIVFRCVGSAFCALQLISLGSFLAVVVLVFFCVRFWFGNNIAFFTGLLLAVSPLWQAMARRALSDSWVGFWMTAALWALIALLVRKNRSLLHWAGLGLLFAIAILSRESAVLLLPLGWACLIFSPERDRKIFSGMAVATAVALAVTFGIWRILFHDLTAVVHALNLTVQSVATNSYAQQYGQGPWFRPLLDALLLSPGPVLLALTGFGFYFHDTAGTDAGRVIRLWVIVWIGTLVLSCFGTRNIRYLLFLEIPYRLGAVLFLSGLRTRWRRWGAWAAGVCFAVLVLGDLWLFYRFFVVNGLYDPVTTFLIYQYRMLPP